MSAQVIPIQPYIERKAQKKQEQYTPDQFMMELGIYWTELLLALSEPPNPPKL